MTSLNAPCHCGSGKKFKRCHGKPTTRAVPSSSVGRSPQQLLEQARVLEANGQLDAALGLLRQLPIMPARYDLEVEILLQQGDAGLVKAKKILRKWQKSDKHNPDPVWRRMRIAWGQNDPQAALALVADLAQRPHQLNEYYHAVALQLAGQFEAALGLYKLAVSKGLSEQLSPEELDFEAAIQMYETAVGNYPGNKQIDEAGLIDAEAEYGLLSLAAENWWQTKANITALSSEKLSRYINALYNLGCRDQGCYGRAAAALSHFERVLVLDQAHLLARTNYLFTQNYLPQKSATEIAESHFAAGRAIRQQLGAPKQDFSPLPLKNRRLRIGYLSADFRQHPVACFITPVLEAHNRQQFEIFAYYNHHNKDQWTDRTRRAVDVFRPVADLSDSALYQQILADGIDILIDLNGYSRGHRVAVLARRAAPLQISWIGYPNTSGLETMDYRIVDATTDPPAAEALCSEVLIRLPSVFSVYTAPANLPEVAAPGATGRGFVFGSFNNMLKLNRPLLAAWADILGATPGSRLLIKNGLVDRRTSRRDLLADLEVAGIDLKRVELMGRVASSTDHLACYQKVDLLLDSFPYNGTTTNCDGLIMGVPVLTVLGDSHISRVTASQLFALGLDELVASNRSEYITKAIAYANEAESLFDLSRDLRQRMQSSPLMNATKLTGELEALLLQSLLSR